MGTHANIFVHTYFTPRRRVGNRTLTATGANEYSLSPEPRFEHLFTRVETYTLDVFMLRFPEAGGLVQVLAGAALPYVYY